MAIVAGVFFHKDMREIRADAKQQATEIAAAEAKQRVIAEFEKDNMNAMILKAAQEKVGTITDKMVEQQVATRLEPIENRIVTIGQIFSYEARMRGGLRSGLDDLTKLIKTTTDSDITQIAKKSLQRATDEFDLRIQKERRATGDSPFDLLETYLAKRPGRPPDIKTTHGIITVINSESDLNCVAAAFETLKSYGPTGANIKMFDFDAVAAWCSRNKPKCEAP
jgi:hypothetical protein